MDELLVTAAHDRLLTAARFQQLADVPPEIEWFAANKSSRRAYENALQDFMGFMGVARLAGVNCLVRRVASRSNVIRRPVDAA